MVKVDHKTMKEKPQLFFRIFETDFGWAALCGDDQVLSRFILPESCKQAVLQKIIQGKQEKAKYIETEHNFDGLVKRILHYFQGEKVAFSDVKVDLKYYSPFQKAILVQTRRIPYGQTRSYGWVAKQAGYPKAFRATGGVMRINPLPLIIPCHRVLGSQGQLTGFSATGGLALKEKMLQMENGLPRNH